MKHSRILVVDDDPDVLTAVRLLLKHRVGEIITERNPEQLPAILGREPLDLVLLDKFAGTYRSLNKIERPNRSTVYAADLFENLYQLMEPSLLQKNIELDIILKDTQLQLELDVSLIEQVLINLLLNAIEAVKEVPAPYIRLSASIDGGRPKIQVSDNGKGIPADLLESIFIPFFTTRKTGSGVGLTLSKQIMLLHGGNILVHSEEGKGSTFTLQF
ncbi:Histidine kinase-, DNA gyrase B-, and HSP90-like ATPase [Parapedobacter composti]|uniref:histidine kinase n=1 Tax=Parapedobacter composti TaxID=623281 RepID=A0A1I1IJU4_9SPHI|nr:ATP-binding protein [Parapedobacter composti]SFC36619.1 Histidine kinase-, DNA gyrase B-, and HSP90-like ATPase [Parapedobacter composti]